MELKQIVAELDVIKSWFSPGSAKHGKIALLADALAKHAGGRDETQPGDPATPTPGPGVRTGPVTVDSVGQVEEKSETAAEAAKRDPSRLGQSEGKPVS